MDKVARLKGFGYLFSIASVILLGIVAFDGMSEKPTLLACLLMGMATSVAGMGLRWRSQVIDSKGKRQA